MATKNKGLGRGLGALLGDMNEDEKRDMKLYLANLRRYVESMKEGDGDEEA